MTNKFYEKDTLSAFDAQRKAQEIAFAPIVFQVSRLMIKFGVLASLFKEKNKGCTANQLQTSCNLNTYALQCLLESSLSIGLCTVNNEHYEITKVGIYLLNDKMTNVNLNFTNDICYKGLFHLEEALLQGTPSGLKELGQWSTVYEGLSSLEPQLQKSWFDFDHFYSDTAFDEALKIVFSNPIHQLLDVGGNTGRWASKCINFTPKVEVTVMDLPQQISLLEGKFAGRNEQKRIRGLKANLLDPNVSFPTGFDAIWMSQFLDCFSAEQIISILKRVKIAMSESSRLYIMETLWDHQKYETAAYCLNQISLYFTAIANGNSKLFLSKDLVSYIKASGLLVESIHDDLGLGHSLIVCKIDSGTHQPI